MTPEQIVAAIVRPLEWVAGEFPDELTAGDYTIWHEGHGYQVYHRSIILRRPHPTLAAAQATAEADYRARIAAALDLEKIAALVEALEGWESIAANCTIEAGVCCCGDDMEGHENPMNCGHSPVDMGAYAAENSATTTKAALAAFQVQP